MKPTRKRLLVYIAVLGALSALTAARLTMATTDALMRVQASAPIVAALMCAILFWWTVLVRRRLLHVARAKHEAAVRRGLAASAFVMREKPLDPMVAARTVALAFAASRAGAYVCGWYVGVSVSYIGHLGSEDVRVRAVYALTTALLSLVLVVIALWLERSCQLPTPPAGAQGSPA